MYIFLSNQHQIIVQLKSVILVMYIGYGMDFHHELNGAIFVSWCANESGDLNVAVPKFSSVEEGISWYKSNGL